MKIPQETQDKITKVMALYDLVDASISSFWGEKRAIKLALERQTLKEEIMDTVHALYPELKKKSWQWRREDEEWEIFEIKG